MTTDRGVGGHRFGGRLRQDETLRAALAQSEKELAKCKKV